MLVLFDIDGTLIQTGRAGVRGMNLAFRSLYGREQALDGVPFAGRTDHAIVSDVLRAIGVDPVDDEIDRLRDAYLVHLAMEIGRPVSSPSGILPGVEALLVALAARQSTGIGLLTGNFAGGARIKLAHFGLWSAFAFGAFGDRHGDRRELVPVALAQAKAAGLVVPSMDRVVVIGDTPLDVDCARAHGARSVAVATGTFGRSDLDAANADLVADSLSDTRAILEWIESGAM
jgi:phosphoglycolate phosphatase-like HAD superfamily hydrolase